MKLKILNRQVHDHIIVIGLFVIFIMYSTFNTIYLQTNGCHDFAPASKCNAFGTITREAIVNNSTTHYVYVDHKFSAYGVDEWRQVNGFLHIECKSGSSLCTYHSDVYSGILTPFNGLSVIAHTAETLDRVCFNHLLQKGFIPDIYGCKGLPDWLSVWIIWAVIVFGGYYSVRQVVRYFARK